MNSVVKTAAIIGMATMLWAGSAWAGPWGDRQWVQKQRIDHGIRCGSLTRGEARALYREQRHIRIFKARAWSDGWLSPRERAVLDHRQNMAGRHIYRLKHNHLSRW